MKLIPLSTTSKKNKGKYFAMVDDWVYPYLIIYTWTIQKSSNTIYAKRNFRYKGKMYTVKMHRFILGITDPNIMVDHENHNGLCNLTSNLRISSNSQNQCNKKHAVGKTSKYKGVCWHKHQQKWIVAVRVHGKIKHLGYFDNEITAAAVYDAAARNYYKEFALCNFCTTLAIYTPLSFL